MSAEPARRLVVDASVGVKWVLPEDGSMLATQLLDAAARGEFELIAPDLYLGEVTNVIWKRARLRGELSADEARIALDHLLVALPDLIPASVLAEQALELALAFGRSVYDCLYVALALRDGSPLVTADRSLVDAFGPATGQVLHLEAVEAGTG